MGAPRVLRRGLCVTLYMTACVSTRGVSPFHVSASSPFGGSGVCLIPRIARDDPQPRQRHRVLEGSARRCEEFVEHPFHGENGGARIDQPARDVELAHLAADARGALQHGHLGAGRRELDGSRQPADTGADHHDPFPAQDPLQLDLTIIARAIHFF